MLSIDRLYGTKSVNQRIPIHPTSFLNLNFGVAGLQGITINLCAVVLSV